MSILGLLCVGLGLIAALLFALYWRQRRSLEALARVSLQVQRIALGGALERRIELQIHQPPLASLVTAVNHLLARAAAAAERVPGTGAAPIGVLADRLHEAVLVHTDSIRYANPQFAALVGCKLEALIGRRLEELVPPEYAELVGQNMRRRLAGEPAPQRYEIELAGPRGAASRLELSSWPVDHDGQRALLLVGVEVLPTQTVAALGLAAEEGRSRARLTLAALPEALICTDERGRIDYMNPAAARLLGMDAAAAAGAALEDLAHVADEADRTLLIDLVRQALATGGVDSSLGRRALLIAQPGSGERLVELSAAPIRVETGDVLGAVVLLHDVTELRGIARQMSYQAAHDALTGLVNRREFERRLQAAIEVAQNGGGGHVLCYLDLDRFKVINDSSGHQAGDNMLRETAKILREKVRDSDTVARLGGDEFGLLLMGCPLDKARQLADDTYRAVNDFRFVWKDKIFNVGVSIGLVEIARDSGSLEEVLAAADSACYMAKRQGGHVVVYSARDEIFARQTGDIQWVQTLQRALRDNRFELYCQPIVAAVGHSDEGPAMEVLVRLRNDAGEHLSPTQFVHVAERYRLMGSIDRWVVQTTLTALGRGALTLTPRHSVAINISGQTLADLQFLEFVVECLDSTGANPAQVCFEIAENAVIANLDHAHRFIGVLHGMGCHFALDDFGSGMGSFSNLKNLGIDYLKIDGSFFRNLARDSVNQAMVTAMIRLARTLNFKVIAEQVEDDSAVEAARRMGVDYLQGFAVGRPAPLAMAA